MKRLVAVKSDHLPSHLAWMRSSSSSILTDEIDTPESDIGFVTFGMDSGSLSVT